jgi:glutamyl-tRNA reductase
VSARVRRPIVAVVVHARQVPAVDRERFAATLRDGRVRGLLLETCHRVEAYWTATDDHGSTELRSEVPAGGFVLWGDEAVRHAVAVAAGRDSVVLGEDQILHQLREALEAARTSGSLEPEVDRLFTLALSAGRRIRSWRSGRQRSLADVALSAVERTIGPVRDRDILVVGAGQMGNLLARAASNAGAAVSVASRSATRAGQVAAAAGGSVAPLDPGIGARRFVAIFVALGGQWILGAPTVGALVDSGTVLADLSVPAAVPHALADGLGTRLMTADDLAVRERDDAPGDRAPDPRTDALIEQTVQAFLDWQARGDARAAADALVRRADLEREAELAALWRKLPALEPEARDAIEGMTRHLAARLLREPLERLGRDPDGVDGNAVRDLFAL